VVRTPIITIERYRKARKGMYDGGLLAEEPASGLSNTTRTTGKKKKRPSIEKLRAATQADLDAGVEIFELDYYDATGMVYFGSIPHVRK
jgi:hypothetical protein